MQVSVTGAATGNVKGKANKIVAIKCPDGLPANFLADYEHAQRNQVNVAEIPDFFLKRDTGIKLIDAGAFANGNLFGPVLGDTQGCGTSWVLACCHRASISSRVACSSVLPCSRKRSSIQLKRRRNFLLVLRRADSGSTER